MNLEERHESIGGRKTNYIFGGKGEPVILLRGFPRNCRTNDKILLDLSRHYRVFGINLPGFGYSQRLNDRMTIENYVDFINLTAQKLLKIFLIWI